MLFCVFRILSNRSFMNRINSSIKQTKKIGDFQIGKIIGQGTFGKVKEGIHLPTAQKVAIKILEKNRISNSKDLERIKYQLQILKRVDHPNVIKLLEFHETDKHIYIITQLIEGKQLFELIISNNNLEEDLCGIYLCQIISAVQYLHHLGIAHRDIKPQNIIVTYLEPNKQHKKHKQKLHLGFNQLKIIDFGLSKQFGQSAMLSTSCGSPCYAAPEMLSQKMRRYNAIKTDIWAIGVTLHAMSVGCLPFQDDNTDRLYEMINKGEYELKKRKDTDICSQIRQIISDILIINPNERISLISLKKKYKQWLKPYQDIIQKFTNIKQHQNKSLIIESMSKFFSMPVAQIQRVISTQEIQSIFTYYYLCWHKNLRIAIKQFYEDNHQGNKRQQIQHELQEHCGPFHMNYVFENYQQIEQFAQNLNNKSDKQKSGLMTQLTNKHNIVIRNTVIKIKKIGGTQLLYLDLPAYFLLQY